MSAEQRIIINEYRTGCGRIAGHITLNKPASLNALDLDMASAMLNQLKIWAQQEDVLFIIIDGAGEKAFCAGGDIVSMYHAMKSAPGTIPPFIRDFFAVEYELDYTLHTYPKPVVVWGDGIVMGGGMGLLQGASHRVVTDKSRLAMPEVTIGLFPDVGGSYFLPRLTGQLGLFLGLTAAQVNGAEAVKYGLADHLCTHSDLADLITRWKSTEWKSGSREDVAGMLAKSLNAGTADASTENSQPGDRIAPWLERINAACSLQSVQDVVAAITAIDAGGDKWMLKAQQALASGSSLTAALFYRQFQKGKTQSLADSFRMELNMACHCAQYGELQEGIRALLIDKDGKPGWRFDSVAGIPDSDIEPFFSSPWQSGHPLAGLGESI